STDNRPYEINTIGNDEPEYQHSITGQTLRGHEFDITGLTDGQRYEYRLGVAVDSAAPTPSNEAAWTEVKGEFISGGAGNEPVYVLGDLQAQSHDPAELGLLRGVLDRLQTEQPGGTTAVQLGDLVNNGARGEFWEELTDHVFEGLDLQWAPVAGNHETFDDLEYNSRSDERMAIFSNMYDLPKNGVIGESNYSFDRGEVHYSVLNSNYSVDEQLAWLINDVRSSSAEWHVVMGHFSYYGGNHADDPGMAVNRDKVTKVLDQLGVDLYLGAHDHIYKRSTIYDGRLAKTPEEEAAGTTFVTMGSSGPKFYDTVPHWWDDVVFDEDIQMGGVVEVTDAGLELSVHTIDGRVVDQYTVKKPTGTWKASSAEITDGELPGVGLLSHPGSRDTVTVTAATYDKAEEEMLAVRTMDVELDHRGVEQYVTFDEPLPVQTTDTVKLFVWDGLDRAEPLKPAWTVREGIAGSGTAEDPYLIESSADLPKIDNDPAGHYRLTTDLDLGGEERPQLGRLNDFTGVLDGDGRTITGFTPLAEQGAGLFAENHGTITDLVIVGTPETDQQTAGLLADINHGTIQRVQTRGSITAAGRVGGIVGDHHGVITDSYSTADVRATGLYSGGVVGIALGGSTTEDVYAAGKVVADGRNAGGVVSYGYNETVVQHTVSINEAVSAPSYAHAIVGRVAGGQLATLADNHVSEAVPVSGETLTDPPAADNWKGAVVGVDEIRTQAFYEQRGWDFDTVWQWSAEGQRPVLQVAPEETDPVPAPDLPTDDRGFHLVSSVDELAQVGEFREYDYVLAADLDLTGTPFTSLAGPFLGEFDGAGHTITGLTSETGGLFTHIAGQVYDLALVDAQISTDTARAGILANTSTGTVERVHTTGSVAAEQRAGGILGDSAGELRDASTNANVQVSGTEAGGAIGVALTGSSTERVYASGAVAADTRNAGGVAGYGYTGTEIRNSLALNPTVTAPEYGHRLLGRVKYGDTATLADNWATEAVVAKEQTTTETGAQSWNGATATEAQTGDPDFYSGELGWDFDSVWSWDAEGQRPVLQSVPAAGADSTRIRRAQQEAAEDGIRHDAVAQGDGIVRLTILGGSAAADQQASIVVLPIDGDLEHPAVGEVAYLNQVRLDATGTATLTLSLAGDLADYALAVAVAGAPERYLAALDPDGALPGSEQPTIDAAVAPKKIWAGRTEPYLRAVVTGPDGTAATGTVTVTGDGIDPLSTPLRKGKGWVVLPVVDTPGRHEVTVDYDGSDDLAPASVTVEFEVLR
ncbi:MAG: metallophosphoesterase, partial [Propionibacteriaceae bacterium]